MRVRAFVVGIVAVVLLVGAGLVVAGYQGRGPLATRVGVTVTHVSAEGIGDLGPSGDPLALVVLFRWPHDGFCAGQFTVSTKETDSQVRVGEVTSVEHSSGSCAGLGTLNGWAGATVTLKKPLGQRSVVRDSDGQPLNVVSP